MKLQVITMIAVVTGFAGVVGSNPAAANDLYKVLRTIRTIDRTVNGHYGPGPGYGHNHGPIVQPPSHAGHSHSKLIVYSPPMNKPPMKQYAMKLVNNAETKVFFSLNGEDFQMLEADGLEMIKSVSPKGHLIKYHNGQEVVQYELDPTAVYSFEWQDETLMLLEIEGKV
jgi:hypothetical protein